MIASGARQTLAGLGTGMSIVAKPPDWDERVKRRNAGDRDWNKNLELRILEVNEQQKEWFKSKGNPVGKICYKFYNSEALDRPCANCPVCAAFTNGGLNVAWAPALGKTKGRCVHFLLFARDLKEGGSLKGAVETVVDVNDLAETRYLAAELIGKLHRREVYDAAIEATGRILQADWVVALGRESELEPLAIEGCYECHPDNESEIVLARRGNPNEEELIAEPTEETLHQIHAFKREMIVLRRSVWPLRELIGALQRDESALIGEQTHLYLRDVYDHTIQVIDTIESFRDIVSGMLDIYLSSVSNRMNSVMKVLTIIATIFIPLTFVAGIYGMNFANMPELAWRWGYPAVLLLMLVITVLMVLYFRRKKWL